MTKGDGPMKRATLMMAALALLLAGTGRAQAGPITWGSATNISGDSDVKTDGTTFGALNLGPFDATVNGVTFSAAAVTGGSPSETFGNFQFDGAFPGFVPSSGFGSSGSFFTSLSLGYQNLLSSVMGEPSGFTLTISNLTVGHPYEFEWWNNDSRSPTSNRTETASDIPSAKENRRA
jgi:hypothetical protein